MKKAILSVVLAGVSLASLGVSTACFAQGGGNGNGGTGGGNAHSAATAGMTHWGDPIAYQNRAMPGKMQTPGMDNTMGMDSMAPPSAMGAVKNAE
jgi:hypothetical protein